MLIKFAITMGAWATLYYCLKNTTMKSKQYKNLNPYEKLGVLPYIIYRIAKGDEK